MSLICRLIFSFPTAISWSSLFVFFFNPEISLNLVLWFLFVLFSVYYTCMVFSGLVLDEPVGITSFTAIFDCSNTSMRLNSNPETPSPVLSIPHNRTIVSSVCVSWYFENDSQPVARASRLCWKQVFFFNLAFPFCTYLCVHICGRINEL